MAGTSAETPLMRQYLEIKARYPESILFFRLGDFYEMFFEDALLASRALDLTLTTRDKGKEDPIPMCGVPHHAAQGYIARLVAEGHKVVVCEQMEDPRHAKGIVKREVTQVVTPGIVLDEEQLEAKSGHYLAALVREQPPAAEAPPGGRCGLSYLDVTTGEFRATEVALDEAVAELRRIGAKELLLERGDPLPPPKGIFVTATDVPRDPSAARADLEAVVGPFASAPAARESRGQKAEGELPELALLAAATCVRYARGAQPAGALPVVRLVPYQPADYLLLDDATRQNLELFETLATRRKAGSLLAVLDETRTAMGGRLIRRWLAYPLRELAAIRRRHDAVEALVLAAATRERLRALLAEVHDIERLAGRVKLGVATPRDLVSLRRSLERLPAIAVLLAQGFDGGVADALARPELLRLDLRAAAEVAGWIAAALVDDPPIAWKEGGIVRPGHSAELDELHAIEGGGREKILAIEARERERTGIASLKVRYNRVFGYYLEVTRANLKSVPADYIRKQTLANAERFVTPELAEYEEKVLHANERRLVLEAQLFDALRRRVAERARELLALAGEVAALDALAGLAELAHRHGYVRPEVDEGGLLEIEDGRHPVVERLASPGGFVPNDVRLDPAQEQVLLVTGPNMAGKSTVLRQVALLSLMAHMGSFVPARRARIGLLDRIFTRVGASDDLSRGDSTFMVEMRETATILRYATRRSLVVLDEIGRGTSTYDGLSIAWAVAEFLHDQIGAKTLFATHYHELCALADSKPRVRNFQVAVREWKDDVVFLHRLVPGGASRSYGIQVARLAGLPKAVILRAREVLGVLEAADLGGVEGGGGGGGAAHGAPKVRAPQLSLFRSPPPVAGAAATRGSRAHGETPAQAQGGEAVPPALPEGAAKALERLRALDPDALSPRDAHAAIYELHALVKKG